jgi:hypothetical protein
MKSISLAVTLLTVAVGITVMSFTCKKPNVDDNCKNAICTQDFRTLTIEVNSIGFNPLPVQAVVVKNANGGIIKTSSSPVFNTVSDYEIFTDGDMVNLASINVTQPFTVEILKNNAVVGTKVFDIGKDCCHIFSTTTSNTINVP